MATDWGNKDRESCHLLAKHTKVVRRSFTQRSVQTQQSIMGIIHLASIDSVNRSVLRGAVPQTWQTTLKAVKRLPEMIIFVAMSQHDNRQGSFQLLAKEYTRNRNGQWHGHFADVQMSAKYFGYPSLQLGQGYKLISDRDNSLGDWRTNGFKMAQNSPHAVGMTSLLQLECQWEYNLKKRERKTRLNLGQFSTDCIAIFCKL